MISNYDNSHLLKKALTFVIALTVSATGCSTVPKDNPALKRARTAYEQAKSDPKVTDTAPVAMYDAEQMLQKAEQAEEIEEMAHLAYLAERQAQIAVVLAEERIAENEMEFLSKERYMVLLKSRELEVKRAKKEAELARYKAEDRVREAEQVRKQAEVDRGRLRQLQGELSELQAKQTDRGIVLTLGDVLFATNQADLMPGAMRGIDKLSAFLQKYPERNVLIEGYTDNTGTDEYNLVLSHRRSNAVRYALIARGISQNRIFSKGYGESYPVADNTSAEGRQQNRRVEIVVLEDGVRGEIMFR